MRTGGRVGRISSRFQSTPFIPVPCYLCVSSSVSGCLPCPNNVQNHAPCFALFITDVYRDDIIRGINALEPLGPGITLITLPNGTKHIRSIPAELNPDQATVLDIAGITGGVVSVGLLRVNLGWEDGRCRNVLEELLVEGMVWVDDPPQEGEGEREYWIPRGVSEL